MKKRKDISVIINEAVNQALREEIESSKNIETKTTNLISMLHNCQKDLRELHWNTRNNAQHLATDKAIKSFFELEDRMAETFIGQSTDELLINDTKPSEKNFEKILNEISEMASDLKKEVSDKNEYDRLCAVIDEICEGCSQMLYSGQMK